MSRHVLLINGPNLGKLGAREKEHYGSLDYASLERFILDSAAQVNIDVDVRQSDDEATIVGWLHDAMEESVPVILNPAAFTHYSVAIRDACAMLRAPLIEVHLSNPISREEFRHTSLISGVATGTIAGFKEESYRLALIAMASLVD